MQAGADMSAFTSFAEKMGGVKVRARSVKFFDHFSQARLFFCSQSNAEKRHIIEALRFELGKVETPAIRERMVFVLSHIEKDMAAAVARGLGISIPEESDGPLNRSLPADEPTQRLQPRATKTLPLSPALSMENTVKDTIKTRKIAILAADGVDDAALSAVKEALEASGAQPKIIAPRAGFIISAKGKKMKVDHSIVTVDSVLFDAVYVPGGLDSVESLAKNPKIFQFLGDAFHHGKAIAAAGQGCNLLSDDISGEGVLLNRDNDKKLGPAFVKAIMAQRYWGREKHELH